MEAGQPVEQYRRYQWIKERSLEIMGLLEKWAGDFDTRYPDDIATIVDLLDITNTVKCVLQTKMKLAGVEAEPEDSTGIIRKPFRG